MTATLVTTYPSWAEDLFENIESTERGINLYDEHKHILSEVLSACRNKYSDAPRLYANLRGPAGTGKTTLLKYIVLGALELDLRVVVTSLTHKACGVLREKFESLRSYGVKPPEVRTLHSLLNLSPKHAAYGEPETFIQKRQPDFRGIDLMIVDECSMLGDDLMNFIEKDMKGLNVLFSGDPYQLKPVGEVKLSRSFKTGHVFKLTEVVRHTGPILDLATAVREKKVTSCFRAAKTEDSEVAVHFSKEAMRKKWLQELQEGNPDTTVMLCFTNANRRTFNTLARTTLYGEDAPRFMKGDTVLSLSPVMSSELDEFGQEEIMYPNNCDIVIDGEPVLHEEFQPVPAVDLTFRTWELPTPEGVIFVLADYEEEKVFKKAFQTLGKQIAAEVEEAHSKGFEKVREAKARWRNEYFPLKKFFADVDFRYALTIHKSQGSTYKTVFVHTDYRQGREMSRELLYVAVTRASQTLHLVNP